MQMMKKKDAPLESYILKPKDFPDEVKQGILDQLNSTFSFGAVNPYAYVNAKLISEGKEPIDWSGNLKKYPIIGHEMNRILLCGFLGPDVKYEELFDSKFEGPLYKPLQENMKNRRASMEQLFQNEAFRTHITALLHKEVPGFIPQSLIESPDLIASKMKDAIINGRFDQRFLSLLASDEQFSSRSGQND